MGTSAVTQPFASARFVVLRGHGTALVLEHLPAGQPAESDRPCCIGDRISATFAVSRQTAPARWTRRRS